MSTSHDIVRPARRFAAIATGALLAAAAAVAPAQPAAAAASPLRSTTACANSDLVYKPQSAFPDTPHGRVAFRQQHNIIERAVLCLVNQARAQARPPATPLVSGLSLKGTQPGLANAARRLAHRRGQNPLVAGQQGPPGQHPQPRFLRHAALGGLGQCGSGHESDHTGSDVRPDVLVLHLGRRVRAITGKTGRGRRRGRG
jgi:hypothetical protein